MIYLDNWWLRYPETTNLVIVALALWFSIGVLQALWATLRRGRDQDQD